MRSPVIFSTVAVYYKVNYRFTMMRTPLFFKSSFILSKCHSTTSNGPLKGIKVLDLTRIIAGPMCSMILADFGADVYKIEVPNRGDDTRRWPPIFQDGQTSSTYIALNRNKKSICVDFKTKTGQDLLKEMAQKCDVLVENYVPGVLAKYSLDYESLKETAPHLIYCSVTGFGSEGPYSRKPGVDLIASSLSGHLHITGPENGEPCRTGTSNIDMMTGLRANSAIIAALYERQKTGLGRKIDSNLFSTAVASLKNYAISYLNFGTQVERLGTEHNYVVPYKSFKSKDGYITLGAINDAQFKTLCELIGKPELSTDERFSTAPQRSANRKALVPILVEIFNKKTTKEWCEILEKTPLPHAPLNDFSQAAVTPPTLRLKCRKPKSDKSVRWNEDTVDNEHMNRKKSKCCCIYKKPKQRFDESSESESDECENCFGHVEVKKAKKMAKTSCSEQSAAGSSSDVKIDHPQSINPSGMTTVSS